MYVKIYDECDKCKGNGKIKYKQFTIKCNQCNGTGEIEQKLNIEITKDKNIIICQHQKGTSFGNSEESMDEIE